MLNNIKTVKENRDFFFYAVLAGICFVNMFAMLRFGGKISLWGDEMAQLGYINRGFSFSDIVSVYLHEEITNLPLFPMIAAIWYRICPYGERWIYIVCIIPVVFGVFFTGLAGKLLKSRKCGIMAALLTGISYYLIKDGGLNFRAYGFTFCFGAITAYCYVRQRITGKNGIKESIPLGIAMVFFAYSNYFACLVIVSYFICDFIFWLLKKTDAASVVSYMMAGILLAPWFVSMLLMHERKLSEFWPDVPTLADIPDVMRYLTNRQEVFFIILLLSMLWTVIRAAEIFPGSGDKPSANGILFVFTFNFWFVALLVFIYSAYINPQGGFFVKRYFLALLPQIYLLMSAFFVGVYEKITGIIPDRKNMMFLLTVLFVFCYFGLENYMLIREKKLESRDYYRESAVFLGNRNDIYDKDTLVIVWDSKYRYAGYLDYYISHFEDKNKLTVLRKGDGSIDDKIKDCRTVYLVTPTTLKPDNIFLEQLKGFECEKFMECGVVRYSRNMEREK